MTVVVQQSSSIVSITEAEDSVVVVNQESSAIEIQASPPSPVLEFFGEGPQGVIGPQGVQGNTGPQGETGPQGPFGGAYQYVFNSTNANQNPGAGKFIVERGLTFTTASYILVNSTTNTGLNIFATIDTWDDSTTTSARGYLIISNEDLSEQATFLVTGGIAQFTGYQRFLVSWRGGSTSFTNGQTYYLNFARNGDKGATGATGAQGEKGIDLDETAKIDGSVVYYDAASAMFKADATVTKTLLTDGGNF